MLNVAQELAKQLPTCLLYRCPSIDCTARMLVRIIADAFIRHKVDLAYWSSLQFTQHIALTLSAHGDIFMQCF